MRLISLLLLLPATVLAACSDDLDTGNLSSPGGRQPGTVVEVTLSEYAIAAPEAFDEGTLTFRVTNDGTEEHSFAVAGVGVDERFDQPLAPGETRELSLALKFGTYELWCPIGDHRERGMETTLQVLPVSQPTPVVYPSP